MPDKPNLSNPWLCPAVARSLFLMARDAGVIVGAGWAFLTWVS